jgi:uncharacterized protein YbaR (Trm112 family)
VHIELVDLLRCPREHAETWLVAATDQMVDRDIVEGTLGCPVCEATYPIRDGAVYFTDAPPRRAADAPDAEQVMRAAALLGLDAPGGVVLLEGAWAAYAEPLAALSEGHYLLLNPPVDARGSVVYADRLPVGAGAARAAAVERPAVLAPAVRVGGRIVAPASAPVPSGIRELARDADHWVGEVTGAAPVTLTRRR